MSTPQTPATSTAELQPATYTATVTLADGSTATHTAEALAYRHESDGSISVTAACCGMYGGRLCDECRGAGCNCCNGAGVFRQIGDESTLSHHVFYDTGMPASDGNGGLLPPIDPIEEVRKHVKAVAERHAARHKANRDILDKLMRPKQQAVFEPLSNKPLP